MTSSFETFCGDRHAGAREGNPRGPLDDLKREIERRPGSGAMVGAE
jgi:hypothetical protein